MVSRRLVCSDAKNGYFARRKVARRMRIGVGGRESLTVRNQTY